MNEENSFAAIEFGKEAVKCRIGDAFPEDGCSGSDAHHAEFVERAPRFVDGRLNMRKRRARKGSEPLRVLADDACVNIVAESRRIHGIVLIREIRKLA